MTDSKLIGEWRSDPSDAWSLHEFGDVSLLFDAFGGLTYTIHLPKKTQVLRLTYRVEGSVLVTNQPSSPREERVGFRFTEDGRLVIDNAQPSPPTYYIQMTQKTKDPAPE